MNHASFDAHALMPVSLRPDPVMVRGEGSFLWDREGRRYLDFVQGGRSTAWVTRPQRYVTRCKSNPRG